MTPADASTLLVNGAVLCLAALALAAVGLMAGFLYAERAKRAEVVSQLEAAEERVTAMVSKIGEVHNGLMKRVDEIEEKSAEAARDLQNKITAVATSKYRR